MSKTKNPGEALPSVLILGAQLNPNISSLAGKSPDNCRILMVENTSKIESKRWHNQRIHLVISAMMHFADELEKKGFEVDYLKSSTLKDGLEVHRKTYEVSEIIAMECAGVSKSILIVPALFFSLCVAFLVFIIESQISPKNYKTFKNFQ